MTDDVLLVEADGWSLHRRPEGHQRGDPDILLYLVVAPDGFETNVDVWRDDKGAVVAMDAAHDWGEVDWIFDYTCATGVYSRTDGPEPEDVEEIKFTEDDVDPALRGLWWFVHECLDRINVLDRRAVAEGGAPPTEDQR